MSTQSVFHDRDYNLGHTELASSSAVQLRRPVPGVARGADPVHRGTKAALTLSLGKGFLVSRHPVGCGRCPADARKCNQITVALDGKAGDAWQLAFENIEILTVATDHHIEEE